MAIKELQRIHTGHAVVLADHITAADALRLYITNLAVRLDGASAFKRVS